MTNTKNKIRERKVYSVCGKDFDTHEEAVEYKDRNLKITLPMNIAKEIISALRSYDNHSGHAYCQIGVDEDDDTEKLIGLLKTAIKKGGSTDD